MRCSFTHACVCIVHLLLGSAQRGAEFSVTVRLSIGIKFACLGSLFSELFHVFIYLFKLNQKKITAVQQHVIHSRHFCPGCQDLFRVFVAFLCQSCCEIVPRL